MLRPPLPISYSQFPQGGGVVKGSVTPVVGGVLGGIGSTFIGYQTPPAAIANVGVETAFASPWTMPANTLALGYMLRVRAAFKYSTTGTPTLQVNLRIGGLAGLLVAQAAGTMSNNVANAKLAFEADVAVSAGPLTAATMMYGFGQGIFANVVSTVAAQVFPSNNVSPSGVVDLTANQAVGFTVLWGAASPSNTITIQVMSCEVLNPAATA